MPEHAKGKPLEVWFQDEARVGQQGTLTRKWARRGTRPRAPRDTRYKWSYIFGAACPARGTAAGLILPYVNAEAMGLHLNEIAKAVAHGAKCHAHRRRGWLARGKMLASTRQYYARETAAILTRTEPHGKRLGLSAVKQTRYLGLRHLRGNPRKMCPSVELLRQRSRTNNFNHQKKVDKGQLLGRSVLINLISSGSHAAVDCFLTGVVNRSGRSQRRG